MSPRMPNDYQYQGISQAKGIPRPKDLPQAPHMSQLTCFVVDVASPVDKSSCLSYVEYVLLNKAHAQRKTDYVQVALANVSDEESDPALPVNMALLGEPRGCVTVKKVGEWMERMCGALNRGQSFDQDQGQSSGSDPGPGSDPGQLFNALLVVVLKLKEFVGKRKIRTRIVVFSGDTLEDVTDDELEVFQQQCPFEVVMVGDSDALGNEKPRPMPWQCVPVSLMAQTIADPRPKVVRPVRTFEGQLRLGDPNASGMCINVEAYPGTKQVSLESRKVMRRGSAGAGSDAGQGHGEGLAEGLGQHQDQNYSYKPVKSVIEYGIESEEQEPEQEPDQGQRPAQGQGQGQGQSSSVSPQYVSKSYRYGSDYVALPQAIDEKRQFHAAPGIDVRGFLDIDKLERHYVCSEATYVVPDCRNGTRADYLGFCALVDALAKQKRLALARFVPRSGTEVQMCVLYPYQGEAQGIAQGKAQERVLVMSRVPMAEEERGTGFGRWNPEPKGFQPKGFEPSSSEPQADSLMDQFVDAMAMDDEGDIPLQKYTDVPGLPLPTDLEESLSNQALLPAIPLHLQHWAILHKVHEQYIAGRLQDQDEEKTLLSHRTPPMSQAVTSKITPNHGPLELASQLKDLFGTAKQVPQRATSQAQEQAQEQDQPDPRLLDLDVLLDLQ